jgi:hypothetical protein
MKSISNEEKELIKKHDEEMKPYYEYCNRVEIENLLAIKF